LLQPPFELILRAVDHIEIVIGQLAPLLLHLLPISFDSIPVRG
jgi:hypothetical protein